jgi:hypothetical protein
LRVVERGGGGGANAQGSAGESGAGVVASTADDGVTAVGE